MGTDAYQLPRDPEETYLTGYGPVLPLDVFDFSHVATLYSALQLILV